ncbi:MAG: hypothetical protein ACHQZR_05735 [Candidatus Limnocylindrales bacterium]
MTDPAALRMARLHLRTGLPTLARVELETLADAEALDAAALVDLAEARWRGGDVAAAGEAAQAHLDQGGDRLLAQVVAVEALSAAGRHRDARRLAQQVLGRADVDGPALEAVFAGHVPSSAWPTPASAAQPTADEGPSLDAVDAAADALTRGDLLGASVQLALLLRDDPTMAPAILSVAELGLGAAGTVGPAAAGLYLVRGDALQLLGRPGEASAAFQSSRRAMAVAAPREDST